jgi:hypothetical protein
VLSEHLRLDIATAMRRGHVPRPLPPVDLLLDVVGAMDPEERRATLDALMSPPALDPGAPVPGCSCSECTGVPVDHPARIRTLRPHHRGEDPHSHDGEMDRLVKEARSRPILDVSRSLSLEPRKAGREWVASCPFHEDRTPSLGLNPGKGLWHCFGCGRGGDVIRLVMETMRIPFVDAVRELAS